MPKRPCHKRMVDLDRKYLDLSPEQMIELEITNSLKKIVQIRDTGKKEDNQLRAAKILLDKWLPDRLNVSGGFAITFTEEEKE